MVTDTVSVQDLYPSAEALFSRPGRAGLPFPYRRLAFAWLLAGALAAVLGQRIISWLDRNI